MAKKYLNKNVMFLCGKGIGVFFSPQNGSSNVKINGADALLNDCRLKKMTPGLCSGLENPPGPSPFLPCPMPVISGSWKNKVTLKNGIRDVLSSDCSITCPIKKGKITPFFPTTLMLNVDDNARAQSVKIDQLSNKDTEKNSGNMESAEPVKQLPPAEPVKQLSPGKTDVGEKISSTVGESYRDKFLDNYNIDKLNEDRLKTGKDGPKMRKLKHVVREHGSDFDCTTSYKDDNMKSFVQAIDKHLKDPDTRIIQDNYRGDPVFKYYNPKTNLNVILYQKDGSLVSGWRLDPDNEKDKREIDHLTKLMKRGK